MRAIVARGGRASARAGRLCAGSDPKRPETPEGRQFLCTKHPLLPQTIRDWRFGPVRFRLLSLALCLLLTIPAVAARDARLLHSFRRPDRNGWIYVHLEGTPEQIGFQHGYWLAPEIGRELQIFKISIPHNSHKSWEFYRNAAQTMMLPHIEAQYRQELQGIADGLNARGVHADLDDVIVLNAFEEMPDYYVPWYNQQHHIARLDDPKAPGNCSAFIATGSYTKDGKIVMGHNTWTSYFDGEHWNVIFDIAPKQGHRILMDGIAGVITSDDDFAINSAGIMITETTITQFEGWNPDGIPEFVRSRKAIQY